MTRSDPASPSVPLRVGVLLCDHVDVELQLVAGGDYDEVFLDFLTTAASSVGVSIEVVMFDAVNGVLPASPDECGAWVISGSRHAAYTDDPWVVGLRGFVRSVIERGGRVAGICFGHQIVATALGGVVEPTSDWKLGPQRLSLDATPWFDATTLHLHAMHRDAVTSLPAGAQIIGAGTTAEVPAYVVGDNVLCVQDHPEFSAEYCAGLINARSDRIDAETAEAALATITRQPTDGRMFAEAIVRFLSDSSVLDPVD